MCEGKGTLLFGEGGCIVEQIVYFSYFVFNQKALRHPFAILIEKKLRLQQLITLKIKNK